MLPTPTYPITTQSLYDLISKGTDRMYQRLCVFGHSGAEPYGVFNQYGWPNKVARTVGAELYNIAMSGSVMSVSETSTQRGGYASALNLILPNDPQMTTATKRTPRRVAPYTPFADLYACQGLSNDLGLGTGTPTKQKAMDRAQDTLECIIASRCRAGAIFNDDDAQIAYGNTWTALTNLPQIMTYGTGKYTGVVGAYVEFTTLADFYGEVVFNFIVGSSYGGQIEFRDTTSGTPGTLLGTLDCSTIGGPAASYRMTYKRLFMGASSGVRKIRATVTGISGSNDGTAVAVVGFDSISVTAIDALPLVVLIDHPDFPGAVAGDANIISAGVSGAVAKFTTANSGYPDDRVVNANFRTTFAATMIGGVSASAIASTAPRTLFNNPDGHANEIGHTVEATAIMNAIQASTRVPQDSYHLEATCYAGPAGRIIQPVGTLLAEASYATNWASGTLALGGTGIDDDMTAAQYSRDSTGWVSIRGVLKKTSGAASLLEQITVDPLPMYVRPAESVTIPCTAITTGNVASAGSVVVGSNGHIYHLLGIAAANTQLFLQGGWHADGGIRDATHTS